MFYLLGFGVVALLAVITTRTGRRTGVVTFAVLVALSLVAFAVFSIPREGISDYSLGALLGTPLVFIGLRRHGRTTTCERRDGAALPR